MFVKIDVLKNFAIFTGKHFCWTLFLIQLQAFRSSFIQKRLQHVCFPLNIAKLLRSAFLEKTTDGCSRLSTAGLIGKTRMFPSIIFQSKFCERSFKEVLQNHFDACIIFDQYLFRHFLLILMLFVLQMNVLLKVYQDVSLLVRH